MLEHDVYSKLPEATKKEMQNATACVRAVIFEEIDNMGWEEVTALTSKETWARRAYMRYESSARQEIEDFKAATSVAINPGHARFCIINSVWTAIANRKRKAKQSPEERETKKPRGGLGKPKVGKGDDSTEEEDDDEEEKGEEAEEEEEEEEGAEKSPQATKKKAGRRGAPTSKKATAAAKKKAALAAKKKEEKEDAARKAKMNAAQAAKKKEKQKARAEADEEEEEGGEKEYEAEEVFVEELEWEEPEEVFGDVEKSSATAPARLQDIAAVKPAAAGKPAAAPAKPVDVAWTSFLHAINLSID